MLNRRFSPARGTAGRRTCSRFRCRRRLGRPSTRRRGSGSVENSPEGTDAVISQNVGIVCIGATFGGVAHNSAWQMRHSTAAQHTPPTSTHSHQTHNTHARGSCSARTHHCATTAEHTPAKWGTKTASVVRYLVCVEELLPGPRRLEERHGLRRPDTKLRCKWQRVARRRTPTRQPEQL